MAPLRQAQRSEDCCSKTTLSVSTVPLANVFGQSAKLTDVVRSPSPSNTVAVNNNYHAPSKTAAPYCFNDQQACPFNDSRVSENYQQALEMTVPTPTMYPPQPEQSHPHNAKHHRRLILALLILLHFSAFACYSLMAPFFPTVMVAKGGNATYAAWVMAVYQLALLFMSPFLGAMVTDVGSKLMLNVGVLTLACSSILFGFMWRCPPGYQFILLSFAIRLVEGVGMASYLTASFSIVANTFPGDTGFAMGLLQTSLGIGLTLGPVIGGLLYELGGFALPFFLFGGILLASNVVVAYLLPQQPDTVQTKTAGFFRLLRIPHIALDALALVASSYSLGFFESIIALHIAPLVDNNALYISFAILCTGLFQGISAPLWGKAADLQLAPPKLLLTTGCVLTTLAWLFIGPVPFIPVPTMSWIIIIAVAVMGVGNGCLLAIPFGDALAGAIPDVLKCVLCLPLIHSANGYPNNFDTFGHISALFPCMYALGAVVGPLVGGPLVDGYGFATASLAVLGVQVVSGILLGAYEVRRTCGKTADNRVAPTT